MVIWSKNRCAVFFLLVLSNPHITQRQQTRTWNSMNICTVHTLVCSLESIKMDVKVLCMQSVLGLSVHADICSWNSAKCSKSINKSLNTHVAHGFALWNETVGCFFFDHCFTLWLRLALLPYSNKVLRLTQARAFLWGVSSAHYDFLPRSKDTQVNAIGNRSWP